MGFAYSQHLLHFCCPKVFVEATFPYVDAGVTVHDTLDSNLLATVAYSYEANPGSWTAVAGINTRIVGTYQVIYNVRNSHDLYIHGDRSA